MFFALKYDKLKEQNKRYKSKNKGEKILEIKGEVTDIIYQNDVNSYTIAVFETDEEETTIVGYLPFVKSGDTLKLEGKFV